METLLARGADVNATEKWRGQTALMWAVAQKHPSVVKVLLARGADPHARSDAWSQVMAVFPHGILDYNRSIPHGADTALMFAARVGDLDSARLLVAAGAARMVGVLIPSQIINRVPGGVESLSIDGRVVTVALAATVLAALVSGLGSVWQ